MHALVNKPLLWDDRLLGFRMKAALHEKRNLLEALDRHLALVYKRRLFALRQFSKLA